MKTSVIRYRVADFLKQYPPFNELSEDDLLNLAASGRVVFHESDEYIFRKNQQKGPSIWVIQQGSVEIIDETPQGEHLRDLLGEGDLLATEPGSPSYRNSAKTTSDVILYTIDAEQFAQLAARNPRVTRYLAAITNGYSDDARAIGFQGIEMKAVGRTTWLDTPGPSIDFLHRHLLAVRPGITVRDAAIKMAQAPSDWCAVEGENRQPLGLVTNRELRDHVANGSPADALIETIMNTRLATASPDLTAGEYFQLMTQHRCRALTITADGTAHSPLEGVVTDSDLSPSTGHNPALLLERTLESSNSHDWSHLLQPAKRLLASALAGPSNVDLCAQIATEFQNAMLEAIIRRAEVELAAEGFSKSSTMYCWLLFGRAGRGETIVPFQPELGLVCDDCSTGSGTDSRKYFSAVLDRTLSYLAECGLQPAPDPVLDLTIPPCQSLAQWKKVFQARIADPIGSAVYRSRMLFDFQPLSGDRSLVSELNRTIASELKRSGPFIPIMANDTMSNLPPLTFFRGLVVELDGAQRDTLDVETTALGPITDAARVFALAAGDLHVTNTLARLEQAAISLPAHSAVLREAAQAFRVATHQQAIASFGGEGTIIRPSILGRYDQRLLKTAFDAIQRLLELSSTVFDVAA